MSLERADDLVAAEQERQCDQQAAGGDERDHVGDAGHQHATGARTPRLAAAAARADGRSSSAAALRPRRAGRSGRRRSAGPPRSSSPRRPWGASRRRTTSGLPAKRPRSRTPTSTAKIAASALAITSAAQRRGAGRALGLDGDVDAGALGGGLQSLRGHVGVRDAGRARGHRDQARGRAGGAGSAGGLGGGGRRGVPRRRGRGGGGPRRARQRARRPTTAVTSRPPRPGSRAPQASVKSFFTSARASWVSSLRWVASPPAGAAMRKARSAGPSLAPKSVGR